MIGDLVEIDGGMAIMAIYVPGRRAAAIPCDGRAVSRSVWADLFVVLGTAYGNGDGTTTFNVPMLNGHHVGAFFAGESGPEVAA